MKITADNIRTALQGATIVAVDQQGKGIPNVAEFDTDTFLCCLLGGGRAVAAGFAVICSSQAQLERLLAHLPAALFHYVYPEIAANYPGAKEEVQAVSNFIAEQLNRRTKLLMAAKPKKEHQVLYDINKLN